MIKKIGYTLLGGLYIAIYIMLSIKIFSGDGKLSYAKNEFMFGSMSLIGSFIFMTLILLVVCNFIIDKLYKQKRG